MSMMKAPTHGGDIGDLPLEVVDVTTLGQIVKSETDMQITTAKRYPRSLTSFLLNSKTMIELDPEIAAGCWYSVPRAGKTIEGPSIRLAEIVYSCWGNMRAAARVISDDGKMVTAQGFCWDLEKNTAVSMETQRRVTGKNGQRFSDDMVITTCNAAAAIAFRNAIFKIIPKIYVNQLLNHARGVAAGDIKDLPKKREMWIGYFKKLKVTEKEVFKLLEVKSTDDITLDHVATMMGIANALKDNQATVDSIFRAPNPDEPVPTPLAERMKGSKPNGHKPAPEPQPLAEGEIPNDATDLERDPKEIKADALAMIGEYLGEKPAPKDIGDALMAAYGIKDTSKLDGMTSAQLEAGLPKLKAWLDALPDA